MVDAAEKRFNTSTLVAASGPEIGTFHKWRSRNGLFPETMGAQGWNKFSLIDICVVRIIVVLTAHKLSADLAVNLAQRVGHTYLSSLFGQNQAQNNRFLALYRGDPNSNQDATFILLDDEDTIIDGMRQAGSAAYFANPDPFEPHLGGVLTIIDLVSIVSHVIQRIRMLEPESLPKNPFQKSPFQSAKTRPTLPTPAMNRKVKSAAPSTVDAISNSRASMPVRSKKKRKT
jgi:hypothetical protein